MLKKYIQDQKKDPEKEIIDSLVDHTNIDDQELLVLTNMIKGINKLKKIEILKYQEKIEEINNQSHSMFEKITLKIIRSNFTYQKYSEILQLHQKIDLTSRIINKTAKHLTTYIKLESELPEKIYIDILKLIRFINNMHNLFKLSLDNYKNNQTKTLAYVHEIHENKKNMNLLYLNALENLYILGNNEEIKIGSLRCTENILLDLESITLNILNCAINVECLLVNHK